LVAFEAPHRLLASLADLAETLGDRQAAACRELTKLHEEVARGRISDLLALFRERSPRGEFTLVVAPPDEAPALRATPSQDLAGLASRLREQGVRSKEAVQRMIDEAGVSRRDAYQAWLNSA
jgi:16S rRNA (cytidine1402-2'-O)-methyltransferase